MDKLRLFLVLSVLPLLVAACGGGSNSSSETPTQPVTISLSELSATVEISTTHQFNSTVENANDTSVDWKVNKVSGGNSTAGTISDSGLYTAPDHVPSPETVTVTAVSHADATKEASATVTLMSNVTISISPEEATIPAGATQQFTASVKNAKDTAVTWNVNDVAGGSATLGTITSAGLYTAPSLPPPGGAVTITAISAADSSKTADVNTTIQFSNASLNGPYVFSMSGNTLGLGTHYAAGRFVADGKGNIVSGTEDLRQTDGVSAQLSLTGTYEIQPGSAGRGSLTLNVEGFTEPVTYRFQLTSSGEGPLVRFENSSTGSGQIYKQDTATFSNASMNGPYVFQFLGPAHPGTLVAAGIITCDGSGNIAGGMEDINSDGELTTKIPLTGSYTVDPSGRAILTMTMTIGTQSGTSQTTAYLISSDRAVLTNLKAGGGGAGLGMAEKQQLTSFSNASLSGDYVIFDTSDPATEPNSMLGRLTADGAGTLKAGVADVFADFKNGGILTQDASFTGSYSIPATDMGRGTVSLITPDGTEGAIFYLVSEKKAFVLGTSTSAADAGQMVAQDDVPFSTNSLQGTYVFSVRGFNVNGMAEIGKLGSLTLDGNGSLSGSQAANLGGFLNPNVPLTGTYSVDPNGRGQATINNGTFEEHYTLYVVDSAHVYLLCTDSDAALFGSMEAQF